MSSRVLAATLVAALLAAPAAGSARQAGGPSGAPLAVAARTVDSLRAVVERERDRQNRVAPPHRILAGLITILADTTQISRLSLGTIRRAAERASRWAHEAHGAMTGRTLGALEIIANEYLEGSARLPVLSLHVRGWPGSDGWFARPTPARADEIEDYFVSVASVAAQSAADLGPPGWSRSVPGRLAEESTWRDVSIWLSAAQSDAARRCLAARVEACASALELEPVADRLAAWYAPADYPALVEHWTGWTRADSAARADASRCARTADAALCAKAARTIVIGDLLPAGARRTFISIALETGGSGALERLVATRGPVAARLAAAAGVPSDSLLALWQSRVMASRPDHSLAFPAMASIGWALLCAAGSLRRPRCG
jgi:hypothetical protein